MNQNKSKMIRYSVCFVLIALLCWFFPYTGDDWAWGSRIGTDRLDVWFAGYNGRYVGNLIVLVMTRSNLVKALIMSFGLTGIIFLAEKIFQKQWVFYVGCAAMVLMPKLILRQAVVWTAGYSNYVVSLFLVLIYIAYIYPIFEKEKPESRLWHCIPLLLLGAITVLIVEHVTIYAVVLSVGVIIYTFFAHRKVLPAHVAYLIGCAGGTLYMFSNTAYHSIAENTDAYRQVADGGVVQRIITNFTEVISEQLTLNNVWINLAIFIVCLLLFRSCKSELSSKAGKVLFQISLYVMGAYVVWSLLSSFGIATYAKQNRLVYLESLFTVLFVAAVLVFSFLVGCCKKCVWKMLFWNASILCIAAPLFVVNPIGERCFFPTYILYIMLFFELCSQLSSNEQTAILLSKSLKRICIVISIAGLAFYLNIFSSIAQVSKDRLAHVEKDVAKGKQTVELIHLPYESYLWTPTPTEEPWFERYKLFYGLPADLEIIPVWNYGESKKK